MRVCVRSAMHVVADRWQMGCVCSCWFPGAHMCLFVAGRVVAASGVVVTAMCLSDNVPSCAM